MLYYSRMLLRFKCRNYYSIREEQELSLIATKTRAPEHDETLLDTPIEGVKALRSAAIFGANASGKSNLLLAMQSLSRMVADSWRKWEPTGKIPGWMPFLLDDESRNGSTLLEIDFVLNGCVYNYGFEYNQERFLKEWLVDKTGKDKKLFLREDGERTPEIRFPGRNLQNASQLERIREQTRPNSLFLSAAAQFGHEQMTPIFEWIFDRLNRMKPNSNTEISFTAEQCSSAARLNQITTILKALDTGIANIQVSDETFPPETLELERAMREALQSMGKPIPDDIPLHPKTRKQVTMLHIGVNGKAYPLPFGAESAGTLAFFNMLGPILCELETSSILLIDELESSLHPIWARFIVRMFNNPELNPRGAQLIFATHSPILLDLDFLRRDQIWLAEKTAEGVSEFRSLAEYKPRKGQNRTAAYLHGRFGGVPFIDEEAIAAAVQPELHVSIAAKDREA